MTKIVFDVKRDNGYGKDVYLNGTLRWSPIQNSTTTVYPSMAFELGSGPIEFEVQPTSEYLLWNVLEQIATSGGSFISYERVVSVPDSPETINYLDLPDADYSVQPDLPSQNILL